MKRAESSAAVMPASKDLLSCRLIIEGAAAGARQMAVDEVLLESAATEGRGTLRFYGWSEPTLSLGYFQRLAERVAHAASRDCPVVRRQTGGGAILHDHELTYSLALPHAHPLAADATRLYNAVHDAAVRVLVARGVAARRRKGADPQTAARQPFLCFLRATPGDVLVGNTKVCGSAQRRRSGAILQHGSMQLARSTRAPEVPGILEVGGQALNAGDLATAWASEVARGLGLALLCGELSQTEQAAARRLQGAKFAHSQWIERR